MPLPDFTRAWDHENNFYLTCDPSRLAKLISHLELFQRTHDLPGAIVECGVFKGASLARFAMFRQLFSHAPSRKIVAFDTFANFPETNFAPDQPVRQQFIAAAGETSISVEHLHQVLAHKGCDENVELIAGNILETVPAYVEQHPEFRIALLNLDTDLFEPAAVILEHLYPRLVPGGLLLLDDYGVFPGETKAVDEYFAGQKVALKRFNFSATPCYIVKP